MQYTIHCVPLWAKDIFHSNDGDNRRGWNERQRRGSLSSLWRLSSAGLLSSRDTIKRKSVWNSHSAAFTFRFFKKLYFFSGFFFFFFTSTIQNLMKAAHSDRLYRTRIGPKTLLAGRNPKSSLAAQQRIGSSWAPPGMQITPHRVSLVIIIFKSTRRVHLVGRNRRWEESQAGGEMLREARLNRPRPLWSADLHAEPGARRLRGVNKGGN